jgi:hypothetical protein
MRAIASLGFIVNALSKYEIDSLDFPRPSRAIPLLVNTVTSLGFIVSFIG